MDNVLGLDYGFNPSGPTVLYTNVSDTSVVLPDTVDTRKPGHLGEVAKGAPVC